jgi:hypothetical protein
MVRAMTNDVRPATNSQRWLLPLLGLALVGGLAAGAYYNWYLWHPMSGLVITLAALGLLLIGGVAFLIRSRRFRPIALVLIVAGIGTIAGQNVGPDRPVTRRHATGSMHLVLTSPVAFDASGDASCGSTADGSQVVVAPGSFGMARASEVADFHYPHVTIGDMYDYADPGRRDDHLAVSINVHLAAIPADADLNATPVETVHRSDRASTLTLAPGHSVAGGSISFSNLVVGEGTASRRSDLVGTLGWTCGPVTVGPGPDETPLPEEDLSDSPVPG